MSSIQLAQLELEEVRQTIARLAFESMEIPVERVLADIPFKDLHPDFDSLAFLEMQLLLEKAYDFELDLQGNKIQQLSVVCATDIAKELIRQHTAHHELMMVKATAQSQSAVAPE